MRVIRSALSLFVNSAQVEAGADILQVFEAMGGFITEDHFYDRAMPYLERYERYLERYERHAAAGVYSTLIFSCCSPKELHAEPNPTPVYSQEIAVFLDESSWPRRSSTTTTTRKWFSVDFFFCLDTAVTHGLMIGRSNTRL